MARLKTYKGLSILVALALVLAMAAVAVLMAETVQAQPGEVWVDDNTCPGTGNGSFGNPFCSIQDGVDTVADGGTVHVLAGSYNEHVSDRLISGGKSFTLHGAGPDVVTWTAPNGEYVLDLSQQPYADHQFEIYGFTFVGNGTHCFKVTAYTDHDLYLDMYNNVFQNVNVADGAAVYALFMCRNSHADRDAVSRLGPVKIHDNMFYTEKGICMSNARAYDIYDNTFYTASMGLYIGSGCTGSSLERGDHHICNNTYDGVATDFTGVMISFYDNPNGVTHLANTIEGNSFIGSSGVGIVYENEESTVTTIDDSVLLNNFIGNDYGIDVVGTYASQVLINAKHNWWGDVSGPTHADNPGGSGDPVSDDVDYNPWLGAPLELPAVHYESLGAGAGQVVDASNEADTIVTLTTTGDTEISVAKYESQPFPDEEFPDAALGKYIDIHVSNPENVTWPIHVEVSYTDAEVTAADIDESTLGLYYYESVDTFHRCSDTGVVTAANFIWANVSPEEAGYLIGTAFGAGGSPPAPTPPGPPGVPTVNHWGIVAMITLFVGLLAWTVRRRRLVS